MVDDKPKTTLEQRLQGAFAFMQDQIKAHQDAKAFTFFKNVVICEAQLAREDERHNKQQEN